jgi:hypothetical protein
VLSLLFGGSVGLRWNYFSWLLKYNISGTLYFWRLFGLLPLGNIAVVACIMIIDDKSEPFFFYNTFIWLIFFGQYPSLLILLSLSLQILIIIRNLNRSGGSAEILEEGGIMF